MIEIRERQSRLGSGLSGALLAIDAQQRINALNEAAEELTGLSASQLLHAPVEKLPEPLAQLLSVTLREGSPIRQRLITLLHPTQGNCQILVNTEPLHSAGSKPQGALALLSLATGTGPEDDSHIAHLDRLASIGTLSASMAHEIKNALVAVHTFFELLLQQGQESELAEVVGREIKRIDAIVSQMLRFAGPAKPTFAPVHIHETLDHALRIIQHQVEGKKVRLTRSFNASSDLVAADSYQIGQAFVNLLFNALDALGANGQISITTQIVPPPTPEAPQQPHLRIQFIDNGVGIPSDHLPKLFEAFFTTKSKGTGLGLSITHRIIREHRGHISVESSPAKGTTFTLCLPLHNPAITAISG